MGVGVIGMQAEAGVVGLTLPLLLVICLVSISACDRPPTEEPEAASDFRGRLLAHALSCYYQMYAEHGEVLPSVVERYKGELHDKAKLACELHQGILALWQNNILHEHPATALQVLFNHIEFNGDQLLSIGNIVELLGEPTRLTHTGCTYGTDEIQRVDETYLTLWYDIHDVYVDFSATGFVTGIYQGVNAAMRTGATELYWPHGYDLVSAYPIVAGTFVAEQGAAPLIAAATQRFATFHTYGDWQVLMEGLHPSEVPKGMSIPCTAVLTMVDGVGENMARVYYQIRCRKRVVLVCGTWWLYDRREWRLLTNDEAEACIASDTARPSTDASHESSN